MQHRLTEEMQRAGLDAHGLTFEIVTPTPEVLPAISAQMRRRFAVTGSHQPACVMRP